MDDVLLCQGKKPYFFKKFLLIVCISCFSMHVWMPQVAATNRKGDNRMGIEALVQTTGESELKSLQGITVTGTITDENGSSMPGVNVIVKGTSLGMVSDVNGRYSINVPNTEAVLVFSYIGFRTQEIDVGNRQIINITLYEDTQLIEEVVVIGYGTVKKANLAGNVATLNTKEIQNVPVGNLINALSGRISGVDIRQGSGGKPGNVAEVVVGVRGTWNNTTPLFVIDGIVRDAEAFNMLNSADIESFSVLKDASAAAVYGARAANGVFLVNTKRGKTGKPVISYSGSYSVGNPAYEPRRETFEERYRASNVGQMEFRNVLGVGSQITNDGYVPYASSIYSNGIDASGGYINTAVFSDEAYAYYKTHQYDRLAEVYQAPITKSHSLNVSGGNDIVKYYMSGNWYDESGMFQSVGYQKMTVRSNIETRITNNLSASLSVNLGNNNNKNAYGQNDRMTDVYKYLTYASTLAPGMVDGQYIVNFLENVNGNAVSYAAIANGDAGLDKTQVSISEYTAGLKWDIPWVKGLSAQAFYNRYSRHNSFRSEPKMYEVYSLLRGNNPDTEYAKSGGLDPLGNILVPELGAHTTQGNSTVRQSQSWSKSYQLITQLSYANSFGKHAVEGTLIYEQDESYNESLSGSKPNLKVESRPYLNFGGDTDADRVGWALNGSAGESGRISVVGRVGYTYDNRYQASFSFREDLSSKFGPYINQKRGFFPAGNIYWRISEESFLKDVRWLNTLKLRGSLGLTGNDNVAAFQYMNTANIGASGMYWGGTGAPGAGVDFSSIANPTITWEKSMNFNIGLDLGLFNMFTLSSNLWKKHTYDILGSQNNEVPNTFGASFSDINYGIVDSYGFEIEIGFNKQINRDAAVWARGNFSWADNKLREFAEAGVPENLSKIGLNYDRWAMNKSDGIIWDLRPQLDASGNQVMKDYNDGNGPQKMYVVTTSKGNTFIIPQNYYIRDTGRQIDTNSYNNMRPGVVFPVDLNGDGHFDSNSNDEKYWGINHMNPPYNYGLLLGGSFKGFSLEALVQGMAGYQSMIKVHNGADTYWYGRSYGFWTGDVYSQLLNPRGTMPMLVNGPSEANGSTDFWVRDASFVRLKNVMLSYELPQSLLSKWKISSINVFVTAQNLCFLYNALKYYDPEMTSNQDFNAPSIYNNPGLTNDEMAGGSYDVGVVNYPLMRTFTFGINLSF